MQDTFNVSATTELISHTQLSPSANGYDLDVKVRPPLVLQSRRYRKCQLDLTAENPYTEIKWGTKKISNGSLHHITTDVATHSLTQLNPSSKATSRVAPRELRSILWNREAHYRVHTSTPLIPIQSHINPIHFIQLHNSKIHFNIVRQPTSWSFQWSLSFRLSRQYPICIPLLPPSCYMPCPSHPPWLDNSNLTRRPPVTSSLFSPNVLLNTLLSKTINLCPSLNVRDQFTDIQNHRQSYSFTYTNFYVLVSR
jgi:hypothetical protein